jgi:hypothetical protein
MQETPTTLPPAAIPTAVYVEIAIQVGDEKGLLKDRRGNFLPPKVYSAVVPILTAQRIPLLEEEEFPEDEGGIPGVTDPTAGEDNRNQSRGPRIRSPGRNANQ